VVQPTKIELIINLKTAQGSPDRAADAACGGQRRNRVAGFAALHEVAVGPWRHCEAGRFRSNSGLAGNSNGRE
jgi:hypothetical protein